MTSQAEQHAADGLEHPRGGTGALRGRTILLAVTGSIASYKAAIVARSLLKDGATVRVIMTDAAHEFIGPATFAGLTGHPPLTDMFERSAGGETHISLAASADLLLVAPATADAIARLAMGRADDLLGATYLACRCPVLVAPAMHPNMWSHPATQRNVARLGEQQLVGWIGPVAGEVASGEHGVGRLAEPEHIAAAVRQQLSPGDLVGRHLVITAGPTMEDVDPARYLANRSSGKMGFALAERALARGARVTLIAGPVSLPTPYGAHRVDVRSAIALRGAVWQALGPDLRNADALLMAASVADFRPAQSRASKLSRSAAPFEMELVANPDILEEIGLSRRARTPVLVGFSVDTESGARLEAVARDKLARKRVDLMIANEAADALERDENRAMMVADRLARDLGLLPKPALADEVLGWLAAQLEERAA